MDSAPARAGAGAGAGAVAAGEDRPDRGGVSGPAAAAAALQQCQLIQSMIDISISSLQGLRTKCAASNDLTQQEIRTVEVKLTNYICKQLQCKRRVAEGERTAALDRYPRLGDWLRTINLKPELLEAVPEQLSLETLLQMSSSQMRETMKKLGTSSEDCSRISAALSCLKSATEQGVELKEDGIPWIVEPTSRAGDGASQVLIDQLSCQPMSPVGPPSPHSLTPSTPGTPATPTVSVPTTPVIVHSRSVSVSGLPCSEPPEVYIHNGLMDPFPSSPKLGRFFGHLATPPVTPPSKKRNLLKPPRTPPPPSRMLLAQLLPSITRSKSHESQLANRIEEPPPSKPGKKNRPTLNGCGGSVSEDSALLSARTPVGLASFVLPSTPTLVEDSKNNLHRSSPQTVRRDIGLPVTHRFSTKSWLSQVCQVCHKNMMFGVKCKHCKLKCHNRCTKDAPPCRISLLTLPIRRTESVPDINTTTADRPSDPQQFGTLPKVVTKKEPSPLPTQLDSSSNPSSTTSSTPSSPAPFNTSNVTPPPVPPNPSPKGGRDGRFHFPAVFYYQPRQQFIFPDVSGCSAQHPETYHSPSKPEQSEADLQHHEQQEEEQEEEEEEEEEAVAEEEEDGGGDGDGEDASEDSDVGELEDVPNRRGSRWRGPISRKASQTSVYLQEWDVPFDQLELGELIGKGRWGKVHRGRWHGEVAVRLMEIDGTIQEHLKLFKKEVMNYRQTRHENVVLFMGACMNPPQLAIITSFCKGRTLFSAVRDSKFTLDLNKTRQIAQEIVKGMGYLHAKGIVHKDLKSKNVFYDSNKVVITDFGLFGMSGVVQEGRRENELKLPHGWICYLAPEIVRRMTPGSYEDSLPFSKAADVYAFGTIWYELQARDWPITKQPAESLIWLVGSGTSIKRVLSEVSLGKEVTEILSACWSYQLEVRPPFTQISDMLEKLPKLNRRLSHPGHFWKSSEL
ncbi:kinase suppressor of Ras 1 isoform X3 [Denticeps clupeoides]|uniref:kinase suppressor of Ras 1 isoform X3 n=1 Tax=Denticeps clupeoides TaxID=299321 RepID=UPI0010A47E39|nr:kinase suppressor of Ras 1 isoform X3 [Denticeps clupeoides]